MPVSKSISLAIILLISACLDKNAANNIHPFLEKNGFSFRELKDFQIIQEERASNVTIAEDTHRQSKLKIQLFSVENKDAALNILKRQLQMKMTLYNVTTAPYPGQMTDIIQCDKSLKPQLIQSKEAVFWKYWSNNRMAPVVCQGEKIHFQTGLAFFWSPETRKLVKLEYFLPKDDDQVLINNLISELSKHSNNLSVDFVR